MAYSRFFAATQTEQNLGHFTVAMAEVRRGDEVFRVAATSGAYGNQLDNVYSNLLAEDVLQFKSAKVPFED